MATEITRRSFVKGTQVLGAAVAAGAVAGTVSSAHADETDNEGEEIFNEPGRRWSFEVPPDPVDEELISDGGTADVIVVGAGLSGTFAAAAAAEAGGSVIVLQKISATACNGSGSAAYGAQVQCDADMWFDPDEWITGMYKETIGYGQRKHMEAIVYNSGKAVDMVERLRDTYLDGDEAEAFGRFSATNRGEYSGPSVVWECDDQANFYDVCPSLVRHVTDLIQDKLGVDYRWNTTGYYLEADETGRFSSIIAKDEDGGYLRFTANRGIILATGDIISDPEMVAKYCPFTVNLIQNGLPTSTGDGHKMVMWAGGRIHTGPFQQAIHFDPSNLPEGDAPGSGQPWMAVNAYGRRYQNEDNKYFILANECTMQPDHIRWQVFDNTNYENWDKFSTAMMRGAIATKISGVPWDEAMADAIERGAVLQADTLDELADLMGFEGEIKEAFLDECERYQGFVEAGVDEDFKKDPEVLQYTSIKEPPFFACKRRANPIHYADGIFVDVNMQVVDYEDQPLGGGGLYAVGNTAHGMFGIDYPQNPGGMTSGRAMSSGYIAGKHVMDALPDWKAEYAYAPEGATLQIFTPNN